MKTGSLIFDRLLPRRGVSCLVCCLMTLAAVVEPQDVLSSAMRGGLLTMPISEPASTEEEDGEVGKTKNCTTAARHANRRKFPRRSDPTPRGSSLRAPNGRSSASSLSSSLFSFTERARLNGVGTPLRC